MKRLLGRIIGSNVSIIITGILLLVLLGAFGVLFFEYSVNRGLSSLGSAVWWALVTMTTVGYGDRVPETAGGKVVAAIIMFGGISIISLFTATISTAFVTRKLREEKGLQRVTYTGHYILCGWNDNALRIINSISAMITEKDLKLVLINNLQDEDINSVLLRFNSLSIKFIRGDHDKESVLERANTREAKSVLIIPDTDTAGGMDPDEKSVLSTLSVKAIAPNVPVIAFVLNPDNRPHLKKANADEIITSDESIGFVLASHLLMPGIPQAVSLLTSSEMQPLLFRESIPDSLTGMGFHDVADHFRKSMKAITIGVCAESAHISLSDFLSPDTSSLDAFIERKILESGLPSMKKDRIDVRINPDSSYKVKEGDCALLIR